ncbi:G kinase-anchoring protein 1 [Frankliniella fusca]|uniref:G kinase-anchoring protein 1 n=1 Tax=Frankliniella fusca TaxID=407009 RepID=A0AAE1H3R2_9NEOP|nr:G kinase-anchoring protein 1 [Frankliniella fusca]
MLGVASRFSVLKIEGEENPRNPNKKKQEKSDPKKQSNQNGKATSKKKTGTSSQNGQGGSSKNKSKPTKGKVVTDAQWEEWKKKDEQYVDENYAGELQEAILQSKLEYEQNKDFYDRIRKESEVEKKLAAGGKKKKKAMTLEEFKNFQDNSGHDVEEKDSHFENGASAVEDPEFFNRIKLEAKEAIQKEENKKKIKEREATISIAQYQVKLEEKDAEIASLAQELAEVKANLAKVKSRNQKLCLIIGQSEVRDKAEILVELHKLQSVKDELTDEVANLHVQLEQERSKVHSLTSSEGKGKGGKKRTASETHN